MDHLQTTDLDHFHEREVDLMLAHARRYLRFGLLGPADRALSLAGRACAQIEDDDLATQQARRCMGVRAEILAMVRS